LNKSEKESSSEDKSKNPQHIVEKDNMFSRLKNWAGTQSFNPIIIGNKSMALRLHSFFVASPLVEYFDHSAIFEDYSEKNLLIIFGPVSEIQLSKIKRICSEIQSNYKVIYIEMTYTKSTSEQETIEQVSSQLSFTQINKFLITEFVTLDRIAKVIRQL